MKKKLLTALLLAGALLVTPFGGSLLSSVATASSNNTTSSNNTVNGGGGDVEGDDDAEEVSSNAQEDLAELIENAHSGDTIRMKGVTALSNGTMKELLKKGDVTLVMEYTYEGVDYVITIPAGAAENNDIAWYGPLYLAGRYGNGVAAKRANGSTYTVQSGDTMGRIAQASGMTLEQLAAKNPQVTNINFITVGQKINLN